MPQQTINIGAAPDDGTGDTLRVGGDKINDNFTELYAADAALGTAAALDVDPDDTLAADSDSLIPTQQAVKAYVDANVGGGGIDVEDEGVSEVAGATTLNFVGAGVTAADMGGGVVDVTIPGGGAAALDDLSDVDLTGAATGDVLTKDAGGDWVPVAPAGGGSIDILGTLSSPTGGAYAFTGLSLANYSKIEVVMEDLIAGATVIPIVTFYISAAENTTAANYFNASTSVASSESTTPEGDSAALGGVRLLDTTSGNWQLITGSNASYGGQLTLFGPASSNDKTFVYHGTSSEGASGEAVSCVGGGAFRSNTAIDGIKVGGSVSLTGGKVTLYGYKRS